MGDQSCGHQGTRSPHNTPIWSSLPGRWPNHPGAVSIVSVAHCPYRRRWRVPPLGGHPASSACEPYWQARPSWGCCHLEWAACAAVTSAQGSSAFAPECLRESRCCYKQSRNHEYLGTTEYVHDKLLDSGSKRAKHATVTEICKCHLRMFRQRTGSVTSAATPPCRSGGSVNTRASRYSRPDEGRDSQAAYPR